MAEFNKKINLKLFQDLGFSNGEIKVYLSLIELRESTIGPISAMASITSAKTYPILEKLIKKGLISYIIKNKTKFFQVLHPSRLLEFIKEKENQIKLQEEEIQKIIPLLLSGDDEDSKSYALVYEGIEGVKTLYDSMLEHQKTHKEDFLGFSMMEDYENESMNLFFDQYDLKREKLGIKVKMLSTENQRAFFEKQPKSSNVEIRFIKNKLPSGIVLYGDNVVTPIWSPVPTAFLIHSKQKADSYRKFFQDLWKTAK